MPVVLKGAIRLVDGLWPDPALRFMHDLDLLVPAESLARGQRLMGEGWQTGSIARRRPPCHADPPRAEARVELHHIRCRRSRPLVAGARMMARARPTTLATPWSPCPRSKTSWSISSRMACCTTLSSTVAGSCCATWWSRRFYAAGGPRISHARAGGSRRWGRARLGCQRGAGRPLPARAPTGQHAGIWYPAAGRPDDVAAALAHDDGTARADRLVGCATRWGSRQAAPVGESAIQHARIAC